MLTTASQRAWFTDRRGNCILNITISDPSPSGSEGDSLNNILSCMVSELCNYVDQLVELQGAQISSTESYAEWESRVVKHRFLVLGLQHERHPTSARLRLDRRRGTNTSALKACAPFVETFANDQVGQCLVEETRSDHQFIEFCSASASSCSTASIGRTKHRVAGVLYYSFSLLDYC